MTDGVHKITFIPNPVQRQFIESKAKADLFSSRMGEGKSTALAWSAFYHTRHNPGATWYLIRDTWENIRATTQKTFFEWFPPGIMGSYHATNKEFTWASGIAEGTVGFLGMDDPQDASKLMSREIAGFGMDEPAPAVGSAGIDELIFDIAMSRLRQKPDSIKWYASKLAQNNPDETHWTYRKFVAPGIDSFRSWQPPNPENVSHLPQGYYAELRKLWAHRPDLIRRFVQGEYGFQSEGKAATPQWSDKVHLALELVPIPRQELILLWDWGHNPTCIITQKTGLGYWNVLEAFVGDGIGVAELITDVVKPALASRYKGHPLWHIGDPAGENREQTSISRSPVLLMKKELGGRWTPGPIKPIHRIPNLQQVLTRTTGGRGVVQVDKDRAATVWYALRGGWHYHVARTGLISSIPKKNIHSHPGDAMSYGAAVLFPLGKIMRGQTIIEPRQASYFGRGESFQIGSGPRPSGLPSHGEPLPRKL